MSTGYYGIDTTALKKWPAVRTHSRMNAPVARGNHPLVTFSVGSGVARANYTSIAEELASHGYIIALVITSTLRAFFDQELAHKLDALRKLSTRPPEVTISRASKP